MVLLYVYTLGALTAHAEPSYQWRQVAQVETVAITLHVVSAIKLASLQGATRAIIDKGSRESRHGYAKLYRNTATGAWSCHIYVTREPTPATLEHESKHCYGWTH
jgi:hypothetical protein